MCIRDRSWDVTVVSTLANSYLHSTSHSAGSAAETASVSTMIIIIIFFKYYFILFFIIKTAQLLIRTVQPFKVITDNI